MASSQTVGAAKFVDGVEGAAVAAEEAGIGPDHIRAELGELLVGSHPGRRNDAELTVFESLGLAVEDLAAAALCVERAAERGVGIEVPF